MSFRTPAVRLSLTAGLCCAALLAATTGLAADKKAVAKNPAATPTPRQNKEGKPDPNWMKTHEGFVAVARKGDVNVLFLGDSITAGWRGKAAKPTWDRYFAPLEAANFGIGGDRTEHVLWRIQNGELEGITPKVVVLMIGTNNSGSNTAQEIAEGITAIVKEIPKHAPHTKILLLGIFQRQGRADGKFGLQGKAMHRPRLQTHAPALFTGEYRIVFHPPSGFFRRIELTVAVDDTARHYHVPLLFSSYSCASYRGS